MKLLDIHPRDRDLSVMLFFKGALGTTTALQLQPEGMLQEHISKTQAVLLCVSGEVEFHDENDTVLLLRAGEYIEIEPALKHWLKAIELTQLLLLK